MRAYPRYFDWLRYLSAWLLFTYGLSKLSGVQFTISPELARKPVGSLSGFELTWFYYSYSPTYARLLGLTQIAGGALLLFRKTATLGAALMLPVMANIVLINLFFVIASGALLNAALLFASMLALLFHDRVSLIELFWSRQVSEPIAARRFHWTVRALILALVFAQALLFVIQHRR